MNPPSVATAARWTSTGQIVTALSQLTQLSVLARMLAPADFGLMAIATVFTGFFAIYADLGVSGGIIHYRDITSEQLSALYIGNIIAGMLIATFICIASPWVASYYHDARLNAVLWISALNVAVATFGNQFRVLNQKYLRFALMAKIDIVSSLVGFAATVGLALADVGALSLVLGALAANGVATFCNVTSGLAFHRPSPNPDFKGTRRFLRFGAFQMAENSLNYFNSQLDTILIGRLVGAGPLGQYVVPKNLCMRPSAVINPAFNRLALPLMSERQSDTQSLKKLYLEGLLILCTLNFPIYAFMALCARPIVQVLFGERWIHAISLLQILALYFLIRSTGNPVGSLLQATGRVRLSYYWNLGLFLFMPLTIWIGSAWGVIGVASALLALQVILILPDWYFLVRVCCGATLIHYLASMAPPLVASAVSAAMTAPILMLDVIPAIKLVIAVLVFSGSYLLATLTVNRHAVALAMPRRRDAPKAGII